MVETVKPTPQPHHPRVYATSERIDGTKTTVYVLTCPCFKTKDPNDKPHRKYLSRAQRDREAAKHK